MKISSFPLILGLFFLANTGAANADKIIIKTKLRLTCLLSESITMVTPKGVFKDDQPAAKDTVIIEVSHLESNPEYETMSVNAVDSPYIQHWSAGLKNMNSVGCGLERKATCIRSIDRESISATDITKNDRNETRMTSINRVTGILSSSFSSNDRGIITTRSIKGQCVKAPDEALF